MKANWITIILSATVAALPVFAHSLPRDEEALMIGAINFGTLIYHWYAESPKHHA
jgi:hypothetical protein